MASDAPSRVVTSAILFRIITSYQRGVPSAFFHFWRAHAENSKIPNAQHHSTFAKRLEHLPAFVAAHGDAHLLALLLLITESFRQRRWSRVCREAAKKKDVVMLRWAIDQGYLLASDELIVRDLVRVYECGDFRALSVVEDDLVFLQSISPTFLMKRKLYCHLKDVALIKWLRTHVPQLEWRWGWVVKKAVVHGRLDVLRFAYTSAAWTKWNVALLNPPSTLTPGYWTCVRYLLHHHSQQMIGGDLSLILLTAPVELLEYAVGAESAWYYVNSATEKAVQQNNMEVLLRFESVGLVTSENPVNISPWGMNDAMLYLLERRLATATGDLMDGAAKAKRWDIVHYIHDHFSVQCTTVTMNEAAWQGRLDEVMFLHEHRTEGCSSNALWYAAANDHLTLVRYLTEVVHAPGTTYAMNRAASHGHLEVVKYLHTHRSEGCTSDAVRNALQDGHHVVVQYLFTHYRHVFDGGVLEPLLLHGAFEIWETLRGDYPDEAEASIASAVSVWWLQLPSGSVKWCYELRTIRYIVHTLGRSDLVPIAMNTAAGSTKKAWAVAVWRGLCPHSYTMAAVRSAIDCGYSVNDVTLQQEWTPTSLDSNIELHPWMVDARTPAWVIEQLCEGIFASSHSPWYSNETAPPWPVQAAYRRDCTVLAMALEASRSTATSGGTAADPKLSFDGACAAAVRIGHLPTLQWLLEHVDTPVEPLLLDEALFYHRYEVAMWLATHCPEACTAVGPTRAKSKYHDCGYDFSLRQWLESDEGEVVRPMLDIDSLPWETSGGVPRGVSGGSAKTA